MPIHAYNLLSRSCRAAILGIGFFTILTPISAAEPTPEQARFFETEVRPLLVEKCYSCHSEAKGKFRGGLAVDSLAGLLRGGDTGAAVVPGDPAKSLLIEAVLYTNEELQMPPKRKLSDTEIATLTKWVKLGAPWPNAQKSVASNRRIPGVISDEDRQWWAFQPVKAVQPPADGEGWARNPVDRFIAQKLQERSLTPAPEASRRVLIRRVMFDLHGLPPTPAEIEAFVNDPDPHAYEKLIDQLLESPRYGERAARHWLDLVRYADSDGYRLDSYRPDAWRYRDYVIRSFNSDKPYDRFVQEQLAGDELFPGDPDAITATGYLRHWIYEYNQRDVRTQWDLILTDITDTTADVFLGLGLQCARCHDHKFDPLLQKDYYRLQAFLSNILPRDNVTAATPEQMATYTAQLKIWEARTASIREQIEALEAPMRVKVAHDATERFPEDIRKMMRTPAEQRTPFEHQLAELAYQQVIYEFNRLDGRFKGEQKEKLLSLRRELAKFDALKPAPLPTVLAVQDVGPTASPTVIPKYKDEPIAPGIITILDPKPYPVKPVATAPNSTGRRAALAHWITRPDNPLTARVMVNRVWQDHFGKGLAANASDFGKLGEAPSHPELLDFLADRFVRDGWSLKKLHRLVLNSAAYRQSADHPHPETGRLSDPENRLLWRGTVRRLEAEQIRDAVLAASGELDLNAGGPGAASAVPRRTIYTKILRNVRDPLLDVFDAPFWFSSTASRDTTTTPVQSLFLINSQFMLQRAAAFARRLAREEASNDSARVTRAYQLAFGRTPTEAETQAALEFVTQQMKRIDPEKAASDEAAFLAGKIPYRDGQAADVKLSSGPSGFVVPNAAGLTEKAFTIEAFVYPRTVAESGAVRTIAAKWSGSSQEPGWGFGVTGKGSRRKPQTLVMQFYGKKRNGSFGEAALFSDQHIGMNKPYYVAASVKYATAQEPGEVRFYVKDLANDDEPLLTATVKHDIVSAGKNDQLLTLGNRSVRSSGFDGLIDDVRLSNSALGVSQLLFTHEGVTKNTVGYWQFETKPSLFQNTAADKLHIRPMTAATVRKAVEPRLAAWMDLCHVLLNSSEFLYVE